MNMIPKWSQEQIEHMKNAIILAKKAWGMVSPNPLVGALVVKAKKILGKGWHTGPGNPHAEVIALNEAGTKAKGADLYVNLEPCNHHGLTPPCTEAIVEAGIKRVFFAVKDPNPKAEGGGDFLRKKGLEVYEGLLEDEAIELNQFFFKWILTGLPFIILKSAASLDGKIATKTFESQWISSEASRNFSHHLRAGVDAILIGANTVLKDNPELSARPWDKRKVHRQPLRVILDSKLILELSLKIFDHTTGGPTLIVCAEGANHKKIKQIEDLGHTVWQAPLNDFGNISLQWVFKQLAMIKKQSVLVESGGRLASSLFLNEPLVDLAHIFLAPIIIGGSEAPSMVSGLGINELSLAPKMEFLKIGRRGEDLHLILRPKNAFVIKGGI